MNMRVISICEAGAIPCTFFCNCFFYLEDFFMQWATILSLSSSQSCVIWVIMSSYEFFHLRNCVWILMIEFPNFAMLSLMAPVSA